MSNDFYDSLAHQKDERVVKEEVIIEVLRIIDKRIQHLKPVSTLLQARALIELNQVQHDILALREDA